MNFSLLKRLLTVNFNAMCDDHIPVWCMNSELPVTGKNVYSAGGFWVLLDEIGEVSHQKLLCDLFGPLQAIRCHP